jgi:hypothetical protein
VDPEGVEMVMVSTDVASTQLGLCHTYIHIHIHRRRYRHIQIDI